MNGHSAVEALSDGKLHIAGNLVIASGASLFESGGAIVVDGETIVGDGAGIFGASAAAEGSVIAKMTFSGGPAQHFAGEVVVGDRSVGMLTIEGGAIVDGHARWFVGDLRHGPGTITVTGAGSRLASDAQLFVGVDGAGTFELDGEAHAVVSSTSVGKFKSSHGILALEGRGTGMTVKGQLVVGQDPGSSGKVTVAVAFLAVTDFYLGWNPQDAKPAPAGTGSLTVGGIGRVIVAETMAVGARGSLDLAGNATIEVGGAGMRTATAGAINIYTGGFVFLDGAGAGYRATTAIRGGTLGVARPAPPGRARSSLMAQVRSSSKMGCRSPTGFQVSALAIRSNCWASPRTA